MNQADLAQEIVATYRKHGWLLRQLLLTQSSRKEVFKDLTDAVLVKDSEIDACWFSRPSQNGREAWELRLISETAYALFETFESDEDEELREVARAEIETRMIDRVKEGSRPEVH